MRKWLLRIFLLLILLGVGVVVLAIVMINSLAKLGIEQGASYALGVDTRVDSVRIGLIDGDMTINKMHIDNPSQFDSPFLMEFERLSVGLQPMSLLTRIVELRQFEIEGLEIHVEQRLLSNNVSTILANLDRHKDDDDDDDDGDDDDDDDRLVMIDRVVIRNVTTHFHMTGLEGIEALESYDQETISVHVDEIVLTNIMSDEVDGIAVKELVRRLFPMILAEVTKRSEGLVPEDILGPLNKDLSKVLGPLALDLLQGLLDRIRPSGAGD